MSAPKVIFLRNDDVRDSLDKELIDLTYLCLKHNVPISHAVEPANITPEVIDWLIEVKKQYPQLLEIIQHGYDHNRKYPEKKMEFGGTRTYADQFSSIQKGKELMDKFFGDKWNPIFTFPYGTYNEDTLRVIDKLGYEAISSKINFSIKNQFKNKVGNLLSRDFLFNKKVSYHGESRNHFGFKELSVSVNLIHRYIDSNNANHYSKTNILEQISQSERFTKNIGILFHHRFHTDQFNLIEEIIVHLKEKYMFSTIMNLVRLS